MKSVLHRDYKEDWKFKCASRFSIPNLFSFSVKTINYTEKEMFLRDCFLPKGSSKVFR